MWLRLEARPESVASIKNKLSGFTLTELLIVIGVIALLAAVLFPVFLSVRAKGRQTVCLSNLRQLDMATLQHAQDFDDYYPYGGDPGDLDTDGWQYEDKGKYWPAGYVKDRDLWHCPADNGFSMGGQNETIPFNAYPSAFRAFGMSYAYTTELALQGQTISGVRAWSRDVPYSEQSPADIALFSDLVGHWHGGTAYEDKRLNFVMLDGHAVSVNRERADELHQILFTIPAPAKP